jgi:hypothetical protein
MIGLSWSFQYIWSILTRATIDSPLLYFNQVITRSIVLLNNNKNCVNHESIISGGVSQAWVEAQPNELYLHN